MHGQRQIGRPSCCRRGKMLSLEIVQPTAKVTGQPQGHPPPSKMELSFQHVSATFRRSRMSFKMSISFRPFQRYLLRSSCGPTSPAYPCLETLLRSKRSVCCLTRPQLRPHCGNQFKSEGVGCGWRSRVLQWRSLWLWGAPGGASRPRFCSRFALGLWSCSNFSPKMRLSRLSRA